MTKQTALTPVKKLEIGLAGEKKDITSLLANTNISPARFMRVAVTAFENSDVQDCTIESVIKACKQAAQDGLVIDNKEAALVKFGQDATYLPMVQGLLKKAMKSPNIASITARVVYEGDKLDVQYGLDEKLDHTPAKNNRGALLAAYAVARMTDGTKQFELMWREEIMQVARSSKSGSDQNGNLKGIWQKWEPEMWRKTVLKRLLKYLPTDDGLDQIVDYDNSVDSAEIEINPAPEPERKPAEKKSTRTKAAAAILEQQAEPIEGELMQDGDGPAPTQPVDDVNDDII